MQPGLAQQRPLVGAQPRAEPPLGDVVVVAQHLRLPPRRGLVELGELGVGVAHEALDDVDPRVVAERDAPHGAVGRSPGRSLRSPATQAELTARSLALARCIGDVSYR